MKQGFVLWITGMSGAGKTTVSSLVVEKLRKNYHKNPVVIDGDTIRSVLSDRFGYSLDDRKYMASVYSRLSREMAEQGHIVVCATISLFSEIHEWNRENIKNYVEIYLDVPLEDLRKRDTKSIYTNNKNAVAPEYAMDIPKNPDIRIDNHGSITQQKAAEIIFSFLKEREYLA